MNRRALAPWLLAVAACGDPQIHLSFPIPDAYSALTDSVTLKIYAPPSAEPFSCEDLAFGVADPDVVRISLVSELPARGDLVPLTGIDRIGKKLFLAEGMTVDGRRLIVGCSEVGLITADTEVVLVAQPTTRVRVNSRPGLSQVLGRPLDGPVVLRVTDARSAHPDDGGDQPLLGVDVRWRVVGSGGSGATGEAISNGVGDVAIMPALPGRAGPYQLDVKVAWAESAPERVSGFVSPPVEVVTLPGRVLGYQQGRIGPNGEPGLAALLVDQVRSVKVALVYRSPSTGAVLQLISPPISAQAAVLGLLDHQGRTRDRAVVISESNWVEIGADASLIPRANYVGPFSPPRGIVPFGPCRGAADAPELLVTYGASAEVVNVYDTEANRVTGFAGGIDVLASGCVEDQSGTELRTLVIDDLSNGGLQIATELSPGMYSGLQWFAVAFGMSFVEAFGNSPALLLGTQLQVNDFVVAQLGIERTGADLFELAELGLDAPPSVPQANRGGDLDGDQNLDVVSLFARPKSAPTQPTQFAVWAVLYASLDGRRLAGEFDVGPPRSRVPELFVLDLELDGIDDLVVAETNAEDVGATSTRIEIYSMGLTAE